MSFLDAISLTFLPQLLFSLVILFQSNGNVSWDDISKLKVPLADQRIPYRDNPHTFGDLRLPKGSGPHPLAVVIHGGCWQSEYDLEYISHLSAALTKDGVATWTIEYRRIGDPGGGWTGTLEDVSNATDYVRTLAEKFPIDLNRVILIGHSAGGHIALWLAARKNLPKQSNLYRPSPLVVRGVIGLAAISDLRAYGQGSGSCN